MPRAKKTTSATVTPPTPPKRPMLHKVNDVLSTVFFAMWILIGAFLLLVIVGQIRQGALSSIIGSGSSSSSESQIPQTQAPAETSLPGVGIVNIQCVQQALSSDELQKIIQTGDASTLTAAEKAKLTPCVTQPESATPSASTAPKK